jgi:hypothetical protein
MATSSVSGIQHIILQLGTQIRSIAIWQFHIAIKSQTPTSLQSRHANNRGAKAIVAASEISAER